MIIHAISARNVLKYASLELKDLPANGLIAITGSNESGKSTIGETVCFALFGRTFSLESDDLGKVIRWGQTHCSAELEFSVKDGVRYRISRFLDDKGNHSARLKRAEAGDDEEPLALGMEAVADRLYGLIGYEYDEFIESFYLAQREITTPHPHSHALKTMAGLVTLEYCVESFNSDIEQGAVLVKETGEEIAQLQEQIDEVGLDRAVLPGLELHRSELLQQVEQRNQALESLDQASIEYQEAYTQRQKAIGSRGRAGFLRLLSLLAALLAGGLWWLLVQQPELAISQQIAELIASNSPLHDTGMMAYAHYVGAGFALLFLLFWVRRSSLNRRIQSLQQAAEVLSDKLHGLDDLPLLSRLTDAHEEGDPAIPAIEPGDRESLARRVRGFEADIAEARDGVAVEQAQLRSEIELAQLDIQRLDTDIAAEQERLDKADGLESIRESLQVKVEDNQRNMDLCELANGLLSGAIREVSYHFNLKLRQLVGKSLPLFTENRYEHLKIDDDLTVRAFSSEKADFMDLDEISSGTQRQIMLAVRLALSQELVERAVGAEQFLFLDEPFAFFDQRRTRSAMTVLPTVSNDLTQIWIIGQEFPKDVHFDLHIECDREFQTIPAAAE